MIGHGAPRTPLSILLILLAAFASPVFAQSEDYARKLYDKAMRLEEKGKFQKANAIYRKLAREYASTRAGGLAAVKAEPSRILRRRTIVEGGPPSNRVDIVIMGDGFSIEDKKQEVFDGMAARVAKAFLACPTFKEYRSYFNIQALNLASRDEGVDDQRREYDTALDAKASGGLQGQTTVDHRLVRKFLAEVPHSDGLAIVLVRLGKLGTGGGGIAVIGGEAAGTALHEFGHAFGGLGDEYSSNTGHRRGGARAPNITTNPDRAAAPWKHWYGTTKIVGFFEGANGSVRGAWKPTVRGCVMGSGGYAFCVVCREQIIKRIYSVVSPIDASSKTEKVHELATDEKLTLFVEPLRPRRHELVVEWRIDRVGDAPPPADEDEADELDDGRDRYGRPVGTGRGVRGFRERFKRARKTAEEPLAGKTLESKRSKSRSEVVLSGAELGPGYYEVVVEVRDETSWVLRDDRRLLADRRVFGVHVK